MWCVLRLLCLVSQTEQKAFAVCRLAESEVCEMKIAKVCRVIFTKEEIELAANMEELLNQLPDNLRINGFSMEDLREAMVAI